MADKEVTPVKAEAAVVEQQLPLEAAADKPAVAEQAAARMARQPRSIKDVVNGAEFEKALTAILTPKMRRRFLRQILTALLRNPDLQECSKESFFKCVFDLALWGLEPDGRRAHLIPFKNNKMCRCGHEMDGHRGQECSRCSCKQRRATIECTLIIDYKGLAELVRRSGDVSYIHADVVYEKDEWGFAYGSNQHLDHKPNLEDRGKKRVAFYSYAKLKDGTQDFVVMSPAEVDKIRGRSKAANSGPWVTDYDEMGKKTAFRRHSKWLPLSPEVRDAIERDDEAIDASSWDEILDTPTAPEALPEGSPRPTLKDRFLASEAEYAPEATTKGE